MVSLFPNTAKQRLTRIPKSKDPRGQSGVGAPGRTGGTQTSMSSGSGRCWDWVLLYWHSLHLAWTCMCFCGRDGFPRRPFKERLNWSGQRSRLQQLKSQAAGREQAGGETGPRGAFPRGTVGSRCGVSQGRLRAGANRAAPLHPRSGVSI